MAAALAVVVVLVLLSIAFGSTRIPIAEVIASLKAAIVPGAERVATAARQSRINSTTRPATNRNPALSLPNPLTNWLSAVARFSAARAMRISRPARNRPHAAPTIRKNLASGAWSHAGSRG